MKVLRGCGILVLSFTEFRPINSNVVRLAAFTRSAYARTFRIFECVRQVRAFLLRPWPGPLRGSHATCADEQFSAEGGWLTAQQSKRLNVERLSRPRVSTCSSLTARRHKARRRKAQHAQGAKAQASRRNTLRARHAQGAKAQHAQGLTCSRREGWTVGLLSRWTASHDLRPAVVVSVC